MGLFDNILSGIGTGLAVYGTVQQGQQQQGGACRAPSGCFQCQMNGQGDIAGCIDGLAAQLYPNLVNGAIPNDQVLQMYRNALAAVSNPAYLRQSDAYVTQMKAVLNGAINRYVQANPNTGSTGQTTTVLNANGQLVQVPSGGTSTTVVTGIPNSYLIGGGVALLALVYFLKK